MQDLHGPMRPGGATAADRKIRPSMKVLSVNCATVSPMTIGERRVMTAIGKRAVDGAVTVRPLGLDGDEQADLTVHGGLAKAVYAYPHEHYAFWQTVRAQARAAPWGEALPFGALGENLTVQGLLEHDLWVGDRLRLPGCELVVSEPRRPCHKFAAAMGFAQAPKLMAQSGWCGFYLAVLRAGEVAAGDPIELLPGPRELNLRELFQARMRGRD